MKQFLVLAVTFLSLNSHCLAWEKTAKLPKWLQEATEYESKLDISQENAVVLYDYTRLDYQTNSKITRTARFAVKILSQHERNRAVAQIPFIKGDDRIHSFKAWLVRGKTDVYAYDRKDAVEIISDRSSLFDETMILKLDLADSVSHNSIFAYEYVLEENTVICGSLEQVSLDIPKYIYELKIKVPDRWKVKCYLVNNPDVRHDSQGNIQHWYARDIRAIRDEPNGPEGNAIWGLLGINIIPDTGKSSSKKFFYYRNWNDVARQAGELNDPPAAVTKEIQEKAASLLSETSDLWTKINAIGKFTQSVNYVSINENLNFGGGYKPFDATTVLKRHYGDCKDKTALMRSLLSAAGIDSYAVLAKINESTHVHDEWPSPSAFNHCIVGICIDDIPDKPALITHPVLGKILIFDPTNEYVPIGYLSDDLQNGKVLIAEGRNESLTCLPSCEPEENSIIRVNRLTIFPFGNAKGTFQHTYFGEKAHQLRRDYKNTPEDKYKEALTEWLGENSNEAYVHQYSIVDVPEEDRWDREGDFELQQIGRLLRGRLLVFNPVFISRIAFISDGNRHWSRQTPFCFEPCMMEETNEYTLPTGFAVDEMGQAIEVEKPFGTYSSDITYHDGVVTFKRKLILNHYRVPASNFESVKDFYTSIVKIEQTPVVLIKKD